MVQTAHEWTPLLAAHVLAAGLALVLGAANLVRRPKGDRPHRLVGRVWLVAMYFTALSSFFLQMIEPGSFSWIHILSVITVVTLTLGLWAARRGNVRAHAGNMIGSYLGLIGAFIGAVAVPDRLLPLAFQSSWLTMTGLTAAVVAVALGLVAVMTRFLPETSGEAGRTAAEPLRLS